MSPKNSSSTDIYDPEKRSEIMSCVRAKDTRPELQLRSFLHQLGYRFRLHRKDLPGRPDLILPRYRTAIFVHGCFWHQHPGCKKATIPKQNHKFWKAKLRQNVERDIEKADALKKEGWKVVTVWGCELKSGKENILVDKLSTVLPDIIDRLSKN